MKDTILKSLKHWGHKIPEQDFNAGISLLYKRFEDKITEAEFLKECTYFMLRCKFDELKPKPLPTRPEKLLNYRESKRRDRSYEVRTSFWSDYEIRDYLDQKWKIIQHNMGNKAWLQENLTRLEQYGDPVNTVKVRNRIQEFEEWEQENL